MKISPFDPVGALGAAGNIVGGLFQNHQINKQIAAQKEENEKSRQFNREQAQWQNKMSIEQWNRENSYNDPSYQKYLMKRAGLNPDLMYGQGSTNSLSASSPEMASVAPASPTDVSNIVNKKSFGSMVGESAVSYLQNRIMSAQADKLEADADKARSDAAGQNIQNDFLPDLLKTGLDKSAAEIKKLASDANVNDNTVLSIVQGVKESVARIRSIDAEIKNKSVTQAQNWFRLNLEKNLKSAQIKELSSRTGLNAATIQRIKSLIPYEIKNLVSSATLSDSSAGVNFITQGLKSLEVISQQLKNDQLNTLVKQAKIEYERKQAINESHKSSDGEYSTLGKAVFLLEDMLSKSLGRIIP